MRVAVVGASLAGQLAALEIAEAGHEVDLLGAACVDVTLGRVALGYDMALRSGGPAPELLARGAAAFRPLVVRWTGSGFLEDHASSDFLYVLPAGAGVSMNDALAHFSAVSRQIATLSGPFRLGVEFRGWRRLSSPELRQVFDPSQVLAAIATREGAVDPEALRIALDDACRIHPRIQHREAWDPTDGSGGARPGEPDAKRSDPYDAVVDARPFEAPRPGKGHLLLIRRGLGACASLPSFAVLGVPEAGLAAFRERARMVWPARPRGRQAVLGLVRGLAPGLEGALGADLAWEADDGAPLSHTARSGETILPPGPLHRLSAEAWGLAPLRAAELVARLLGTG